MSTCNHCHPPVYLPVNSLHGAICVLSGPLAGFTHIFKWTDRPSAVYAAHTHASTNAHYIVRGDMHVFYPQLDRTITYKVGDRFDVPANVVHRATMGPEGCEYMVGEK